ncbi:hypothetical protein ACHAXT_012503 [Thalassiosira profunda]
MDAPNALPPHFTIGGGRGAFETPLHPPPPGDGGQPARDANDLDQRPPRHCEPSHGTQDRRDANLTQQIAQKLLTAPAPRGGRGRDDVRDVHETELLGPDEPPPIPPWESYAHTDTRDMHQRRMGDDSLSTLRLHQAEATHPSLNIACSEAFDEDENDLDGGAALDNTPHAATATPKGVTFGTHDRVHRWDEALDVLKYVDDEFFNVSRYLFTVVDTRGITGEEYMPNRSSFEEEYQKEHSGGGLLSVLFGCTGGREVDFETLWNEREDGNEEYRLTKKLVLDFYEAAKFRMEALESLGPDADDDDDVVERTRDVVRKINAYGLPLLGSSAKIGMGCDENRAPSPSLRGERLTGEATMGRDLADGVDDDLLDTFGGGNRQQFFPVLPTDDENDRTLSNLLRRKSRGAKGAPTKAKWTPAAILSSFKMKPKSNSPSEEECAKRLAQIGREMVKVHRMICSTRNEAVQVECRNRMDRLSDEQRFYHIIQERYKLQSMMETTEEAIVRSACKERIRQLVSELETLRFDHDIGKSAAVEDSKWYDRVLQYVGGGEPDLQFPEPTSQYPPGSSQPWQHQSMGRPYGPPDQPWQHPSMSHYSPQSSDWYGGNGSAPDTRYGTPYEYAQNHYWHNDGRGRSPYPAARSRQNWF